MTASLSLRDFPRQHKPECGLGKPLFGQACLECGATLKLNYDASAVFCMNYKAHEGTAKFFKTQISDVCTCGLAEVLARESSLREQIEALPLPIHEDSVGYRRGFQQAVADVLALVGDDHG